MVTLVGGMPDIDFKNCAQYLHDRGLAPEDVDRLGIEFLSASQCLTRCNSNLKTRYPSGVLFPYPGTDFVSVSFVGKPRASFADQETGKRKDRKCQTKGRRMVYNPTTNDYDNFSGTMYFAESPLKAAVLSKHGYCAIGGNGVAGIVSREKGWAEEMPQGMLSSGIVKRVVILFDANVRYNADVQAAVRTLADMMMSTYPSVEVVMKILPLHKESDQGIDDYTVREGVQALHAFMADDDNEEVVEVGELQAHFDALNEGWAYCLFPPGVIHVGNGKLYSVKDFRDVEAKRVVMATKKGTKSTMIEVSAAAEWIKYEDRREVPTMTWLPGADLIVEEGYNQWRDDGPAAIEGDVQVWLDFMANAIPDEAERKLLVQMMAYKIRNRAVLLGKMVVLVGEDQGTGKSSIAKMFGAMFGRSNFVSIGEEDFDSGFNGILCKREIVSFDDIIHIPERLRGKLRRYATDEVVISNEKHSKQMEVPNFSTMFVSTNSFDAIPMEEKDRRTFVIAVEPAVIYEQGDPYWDKLWEGWWHIGGAGALRYYLENVVDLEDFNPRFLPPRNEAKRDMTDAGMDPDVVFLRDLRANPDNYVDAGVQFMTAGMLAILCYGEEGRGKAAVFGKLITTGRLFRRAHETKLMKFMGNQVTFYDIRGVGNITPTQAIRDSVKANPISLAIE